jgi:hypothetical protein
MYTSWSTKKKKQARRKQQDTRDAVTLPSPTLGLRRAQIDLRDRSGSDHRRSSSNQERSEVGSGRVGSGGGGSLVLVARPKKAAEAEPFRSELRLPTTNNTLCKHFLKVAASL